MSYISLNMRLLFVSNLYEPFQRGGAEEVVKRSITAAQTLGHEVSLLTARPRRAGARCSVRMTSEHGTEVYSYYPANFFFYADDHAWPPPLRLIWHGIDLFNVHSALVLRRVLAQARPDAVITHNLMGMGFTLPGVLRRVGMPHIHVLHDIQLAVRSGLMLHGREHSWHTDGLPARVYQAVVKRQFGSPTVVVSPSQFLMDFYTKRGYFPASKNIVLRNPVDERFFSVQPQEQPGPFRILFVGQLAEHKGIRVLLQAFDRLQAHAPDAYRLDIVGDGPLAASVQKWAHGRSLVQYHGRLANEELLQRYGQADVLVMPTLTYENSPSVIFEALAAGVPVIVSNIGGAAEPVSEGKNGFIIKPDDVQALAQAIEAAADRRTEWPRWRQNAKNSVQGLGSERYITELLSLL